MAKSRRKVGAISHEGRVNSWCRECRRLKRRTPVFQQARKAESDTTKFLTTEAESEEAGLPTG